MEESPPQEMNSSDPPPGLAAPQLLISSSALDAPLGLFSRVSLGRFGGQAAVPATLKFAKRISYVVTRQILRRISSTDEKFFAGLELFKSH